MKKILKLTAVIVAILSALALVSCSSDGDDASPDGMKRASSDTAPYVLYIPEDWITDMQTGMTSAHVSSSDSSNVSVTAWELEHTDDTVDTWWDVNIAELCSVFTDYTEVSSVETVLCGESAKQYVYTARLADTEYKYMQTAAVRDGSVYVITYTALPDVYDSHLDDVAKILSAFVF